MKTGEKWMPRYRSEPERDHGNTVHYPPFELQTKYIPTIERPARTVKTGWITTGDVS